MAQIRKYQPGGKTPNKIGVLTIDGKEYTGDGFIQHMRDYRKTLDDKVADQFGNIINALEAGENLQYDSDSDVLTGNVDWNVSKLQEKRLVKGEDRTKIGKIFGGLNEGKEQRVRYAINALRSMPKLEERVIEPEKPESKSYDWSKQIALNYTLNKDKSRKVSMLGNTQITDRLNQLKDIFSDTWSDNDTLVGYNNNTKEHYKKFYDVYKDDLDAIIERIENGTWTDEDLLMLADLGIIDNVPQNKSVTGIAKKESSASSKIDNKPSDATVVTTNEDDKKINAADNKKDKPNITEEIISAYETTRKVNKEILKDTTSQEVRKQIVPSNKGRITGFRFNAKPATPNLTAIRNRDVDILLSRLNKNKEKDTVVKYNVPLWYSRDTSNITYIKQGGIIKGRRGISDKKWNYDYEDPNETWYTVDTLSQMSNPISIISTTAKTSKASRQNAGEAPPKWKQILKDYASRAFNYENLNTLGQIVGAIAANHKVAKVKEDALKSMPLSRNVFQASTPAYYENTRGFDVRRDALLNTQLPQTADAKLNAQWKLNIASELDKVNREKYDYLSQNRDQYNQFTYQIDNKNRELRAAESNAFIDRLSQRNMALAENTAGMIANDFKTFEQALKKGLYNYQQDRAVYDQLALSDRKKMLFDKYLKAATDWAKTNKAGAGEEYMSDIDRYFKYNQTAKDLYENDIMQLNKSIYRPHSLFSPRFAKKGGKLSAQDHIKINKHKSQDRILENKYNAIDKAVQKLNDNVIKIFLNMMK